MTRIRIVIPDAGPLITLAKADALDLLLTFGDDVALVVTDMVDFETTRQRTDFADAQQIFDFLRVNSHRVAIQETSFGQQAIAAAKQWQQYTESPAIQALFKEHGLPPPRPLASDAGELSIVSFVSELIGAPPGEPCLILAEDDFFLRANSGALPGNAHIVSTFAFLKAIEQLSPGFDANATIENVRHQGREVNVATVDSPAKKIAGGTEWRSQIDASKLANVLQIRRKRHIESS
jgi:hypothetical protein